MEFVHCSNICYMMMVICIDNFITNIDNDYF